jgi:aromatic-L-amino-acid decarboxylase
MHPQIFGLPLLIRAHSVMWTQQDVKDFSDRLSVSPLYAPTVFPSNDAINYRDLRLSFFKRTRSLQLYCVLKALGRPGLQRSIKAQIELGEVFHSLVLSRSDLFEPLANPHFAIVVFAPKPRTLQPPKPGLSSSDLQLDNDTSETRSTLSYETCKAEYSSDVNKLTEQIVNTVNGGSELRIGQCKIKGRCAIRICCATEGGNERTMQRAFNIIVQSAEQARACAQGRLVGVEFLEFRTIE